MSERRPDRPDEAGAAVETDLAGAWALDALDDADRAGYEALLRTDPGERARAEELRATAALLAAALDPVPPPPRVRAAVLGALSSLPQERPAPVADLAVTRHRRARRGAHGPARTAPRWPGLVAAAAVVVAGVGVGVGVDGRRDADRARTEAAAERSEQRTGQEALTRLLAAPGARVSTVAATSGTGSATFVRAGGEVAVLSGLPAVGADRTYQVWLLDGDGGTSVRSAGLLGPEQEVVARDTGGAASVAISVEPAGGSRQPTTDPLVVAPLV